MTEPRYPTVHVDVPDGETEEVAALLFELGATGVEERDATTLDRTEREGTVTLVAHFDDEDRARIVAATAPFPARVVHIVGDAWKHRWREFFKPTRIGQRLLVRPSWEPVDACPGDIVLTVDPGQAFGTGTHETTRLVLGELESIVRGGERVLDVGCGSGILAIGALLLGAAKADGIDIDDESMQASAENAAANGVGGRLSVSKRPVGQVRGLFEIVLANIESRVLVPLAPAIAARVAPAGTLVLSGLLFHEEDEIREAYGALGLEPVRTAREKDWIAMVWRRPAAPAASKKAASKKAGSKKAGSKKAGSKKAGSKKAASKKAGSKKAGSKKAGSKKAGSKKAGSKKAAPKKRASSGR
ncbi:MAG: 50S ribosomal protein L11 methyltransferase [Sandaracinaceae bacterium]